MEIIGYPRSFQKNSFLSNPRLRTQGVSPGVKASDAGKILNVGVVPQVPRA